MTRFLQVPDWMVTGCSEDRRWGRFSLAILNDKTGDRRLLVVRCRSGDARVRAIRLLSTWVEEETGSPLICSRGQILRTSEALADTRVWYVHA